MDFIHIFHLHHRFSGGPLPPSDVFSEIEETLLHFLTAQSLQIRRKNDLTSEATAAVFSYRLRFEFLYRLNANHIRLGHISEQSNMILRQLLTGHAPFTLTCYRDVRVASEGHEGLIRDDEATKDDEGFSVDEAGTIVDDQRVGTSMRQRIVFFQVSRGRTKYTSGTIATVKFFHLDLGTIERIFHLTELVEYYFYVGGKRFAVTRDEKGVYNAYNDSGIKIASMEREVTEDDFTYDISFFHSLTFYERVMIVCVTVIIDIDEHSGIEWENVLQLIMDFLI